MIDGRPIQRRKVPHSVDLPRLILLSLGGFLAHRFARRLDSVRKMVLGNTVRAHARAVVICERAVSNSSGPCASTLGTRIPCPRAGTSAPCSMALSVRSPRARGGQR